ncbi:MAG: tetratricopeptide repeat protein, partial [Pseudomonadota bacterium]
MNYCTRYSSVIVFLVLFLTAKTGKTETIDDAYQKALKSYYSGMYQKAIDEFERIVALPVHHEDLFYTLGCAYFRLGELGPAIYNFERALAFDRSSEDARFNLKIARELVTNQVKDVLKGIADRPWWANLVATLNLRGWTFLFLPL